LGGEVQVRSYKGQLHLCTHMRRLYIHMRRLCTHMRRLCNHKRLLCIHKRGTAQSHGGAASGLGGQQMRKGGHSVLKGFIHPHKRKQPRKALKNSEFGTTRPQSEIGHFHHLPPPESPWVLHESCS
jgi:hypothetical protein